MNIFHVGHADCDGHIPVFINDYAFFFSAEEADRLAFKLNEAVKKAEQTV